jgi:hypothetical protein
VTATRAAPRLLTVGALAVTVALAGYGVRLAVLLHTDGLLGSSAYDDGVYYAAGASFAHGRWPYADFLFLQPPAMVLAIAPFAALGAVLGDPTAVIVARLVWIGLGAAGCGLVAGIAGRRSWPAGLVAGAFAACFFPLAYGERSTLLEPLGTVLLLVAMLVREQGRPRAALLAGAIAGVTVDVKVWYLVPVLVLAAFPRHRLRFLVGAVAGGAIVVAPFVVRAPDAFVRQVLVDQLDRPRLADDLFSGRFVVLTGASFTDGATSVAEAAALPVAVLVAAVVLAAAAAACWTPLGRRAVALLAATTTVLLLSPSFFVHYGAYTGPWTALVLGVGAGVVLDRLGSRALKAGGALVLTALVAAPTLGRDLLPPADTPSLAPIARALERHGGCVRSDDPGLLAAIGALSPALARGCDVRPDVTGATYDLAGFPVIAGDRPRSAIWQRYVTRYLLGGDAVIVVRPGTGLSAASERRIAALPVLARSGDLVLHAVPR